MCSMVFKTCSNVFKCVQMCSNLFKTCSNVFKCAQTCSKSVQMCSNMFKCVQICFWLDLFIRAELLQQQQYLNYHEQMHFHWPESCLSCPLIEALFASLLYYLPDLDFLGWTPSLPPVGVSSQFKIIIIIKK